MKKLLAGFVKWISGFKLEKFFKGLVDGDEQAAESLKATIEQSNEFTNKVKAWLQNPIGDILTAVIPGTWDNELKAKAETALGTISTNLAVITGCVNENSDADNQLVCVYNKYLSVNDPNQVKTFWQNFGNLAADIFTDRKIDFSDLAVGVKFVYDLITKK